MALPIIQSTFSDIPADYLIPVPDKIKSAISAINNLSVISPDSLPSSSSYDIRNVEVSLASENMAFALVPDYWNYGSSLNDYVDPNSVFILPNYYNIQFGASTYFHKGLYGGGKYYRHDFSELVNVNAPRLFYTYSEPAGSVRISNPGAVAISKESRESYGSGWAPVVHIRLKWEIRYRGKNTWVTRTSDLECPLLDLVYGIGDASAPSGSALINNVVRYNSTYVDSLATAIFTPADFGFGVSFVGAVDTPIIRSDRVYYSYSEDSGPAMGRTRNIDRGFYSQFSNLIFVKDGDDFDSLFTMPYDEFLDRIVSGEKEAEKEENPPYQPGDLSGPAGGGGQFGKNEVSDIIAGDIPLGSVEGDASATGMYTRYLCNSSYLDLIGDWVWDPNLGLSLIQTAIKPLYNDPAQAMISLVSFPFQLSGAVQGVTTRSQDMYFGHQPVLGAQFTAILSSACYIDWGTIDLQEYWGNFLDYYPHTKIEMYLPWGTGFVSIDPGQCLPGTLQVKTNIELARGSCVHNIINSAGCVIGSFAGQCGKQVPLIASDIAAKRAGLVTAAAGLIAGGVGLASAGAAGTLAAGAAYNSFKPSGPLYIGKNGRPYYGAARMSKARSLQRGAISAAEAAFDEVSGEVRDGARSGINIASNSSIAALKTPISIQRNGGFTDGSAGMGIQYPYIILSRPEQNVPENYGQHFGYPSNIHSSLLFLKGYTEIGSVHLNGIPATAPELDELDTILKGGVIL